MIRKYFTFLFLFAFSLLQAQYAQGPEMADTFRAEGKIYIVITVIALIFIAIVAFLIYLERKISSIEKKAGNSLQGNVETARH